MKRIALPTIALVVLPMMLAAQNAAPSTADKARPISLTEAIQLAQRNSPVTIGSRNSIRSADASVRSAYAAFIPTVNVSVGAEYDPTLTPRVNSATGTIIPVSKWNGSDGLNLGVNLFDGGRRLFAVAANKATVTAAVANNVAQQYNVALTVEQAFYNALAARESESAAQAQLDQAQAQMSMSVSKVNAGAATLSDSLRSLIQVQNAQLALLTARTNLETADATLTRLIASTVPVTANPADTLDTDTTLPDSAQLAQLAAAGPAVAQASATTIQYKALARAARAPYLPSLDASFGRNAAGADLYYSHAYDFQYQTSLRFTLSYPLFNQLQREQNRVQADVNASNAEATERDTRLASQQLLIQNLSAFNTAAQQVTIQRATVIASQEDLRVQQQRYNLGASTLLDVLTSQTTLNQARSALIQARYNLRIARAQIAALIGRPL